MKMTFYFRNICKRYFHYLSLFFYASFNKVIVLYYLLISSFRPFFYIKLMNLSTPSPTTVIFYSISIDGGD